MLRVKYAQRREVELKKWKKEKIVREH